ncbi:unnamed protein product [Peniophora sp. CBMAI 1063]|nr:unnamed protein product [Peniophora sp. CBMAI 1063]
MSMQNIRDYISNTSLDSAGLIALADLQTVSQRTALSGTPWIMDIFFIAPGLHRQQDAPTVSGGELPAAGAMHSGFVFRIENPATVFWLQRIGRPGHLVEARVQDTPQAIHPTRRDRALRALIRRRIRSAIAAVVDLPVILYAMGILCTAVSFAFLISIGDYWAVGVLSMLVLARAINVMVFRRRAIPDWKGKQEPGVPGDLLVLLSQDRWVRLRGKVDDLKLITSGQWVRDLTPGEGFAVAAATLSVYAAAALAANSTTIGNLVIAILLLSSAALLGLCNATTADFCMFNRTISQHGLPKRDWAVRMGLVLPQSDQSELISACPPFNLSCAQATNLIELQRSHQGRKCIPSVLADRRIGDPGLLLTKLNEILGTGHSFEASPGLESVLESLIGKGYDLGMIYGMLRPWWSSIAEGPCTLLATLDARKNGDFGCRRLPDHPRRIGLIPAPAPNRLLPRRIWDLYSNRVLPSWATTIAPCNILAVSHAWVDPCRRHVGMTLINANKWPVPLPPDISLDDIRIELLNLDQESEGMGYAWLDVLCLRQTGGKSPEADKRAKEWEVDVPAIGAIYRDCKLIVVYLNGLGLPFESSDLNDHRHWCNRAWTLQEANRPGFESVIVVGGRTVTSPLFSFSDVDPPNSVPATGSSDFVRLLKVKVTSAAAHMRHIIPAIAEMSNRSATGDVDKIAGLAYFFCGQTHPAFYQAAEFFELRRFFGLYVRVSELAAPMFYLIFKAIRWAVPGAQGFYDARIVSSAWRRFIYCVAASIRADLFYLFPSAGDGQFKWAPSWPQLLAGARSLTRVRHDSLRLPGHYGPLLPHERASGTDQLAMSNQRSRYGDNDEEYFCRAVRVRDCRVSGFACAAPPTKDHRRGTITFSSKSNDGTIDTKTVNMIAHHSIPIPDGTYNALLNFAGGSPDVSSCRYWVIGFSRAVSHIDSRLRFTKISVLEVDDDREGECTISKLCEYFGVPTQGRTNDGNRDETRRGGSGRNRWVKEVHLA